jgi:hypothetical protein
MADFSRVQAKLNNDTVFRQKFLDSPVETIRQEGVQLTPEMEQKLKTFVSQATTEKAKAAGSSTASINGGIAISIRF